MSGPSLRDSLRGWIKDGGPAEGTEKGVAQGAEGHLEFMIFQNLKDKVAQEGDGGVSPVLQRDLEGKTEKAPLCSTIKRDWVVCRKPILGNGED